VDVLNNAQSSVEFGIMVFTENALGDAVLDAHQRGLDVTGIIDYVEYNGSEYEYLKSNGVHVRDYVNPDGTSWPDGPVLHHKYMIVDFEEGSETAVLVTGSHNWSASAESINDENTLIIHDLNLANQFHQEFTQRFNDQITPVVMNDDTITPMNTAVMIDFLMNDFIPEDISVSKEVIVEPAHGLANMQGAEDFIDYLPEGDYVGYDSLSYRIVNTEHPQLVDTAWIKIKVGNVGIEDTAANDFRFNAYSNSLNQAIKIDVFAPEPGDATIRIFDQLGRIQTIENHTLSQGENEISIPVNLPTGVCFVEVKTGEQRKVRKIFVH
jgi:hypothetical protein